MATYTAPTKDFETTTLNGAVSAAASTATIGTGLSFPATNGIIQVDYDSVLALGVDGGPETWFYTAYNSVTGALTGITRASAGTTAVAHANGASVQCAPSSLYFSGSDLKKIIEATAWSSWTTNPTGFSALTDQTGRYIQIGSTVFCSVSLVGTSNSTSFSFSLPVAAKSGNRQFVLRGSDNGSALTTPIMMSFTAASTTVNLYPTGAAGNWTNVSSKSAEGFFVYEAN